jgi:RimJ/RimL family protein N-acetyltransferase
MVIAEYKNIVIKDLNSSYARELARLGDNPNVFACVSNSFPNPYTEKDAHQFISKAIDQKMGHIFAIEWNGKYVGNVGLHFKPGLEEKSVELGYFIGEEYWGNGIATQAVELMCKYGFENLDINRINASVMDFNVASQKVLNKCGFEKEGVLKQALFKLGKFHDDHRYGLLKPQKA